MKGSVLFVVGVVVAFVAGFGGGYVADSLHPSGLSYQAPSQVPTITNFKLARPIIENGSTPLGDTFSLNATESGIPYDAAFQVVLIGDGSSHLFASGSFYGSLNYSPVSLLKILYFGDLSPGNYSLVATVMHGGLSRSKETNLVVIPHVTASISGPSLVNDSKGPVKVRYEASVSGGLRPYTYSWSILAIYSPGPQNYAMGSTHGSAVNITFSINSSNVYYGTNQTFVIGLTVIDSLGYSFSFTAESIYGNEGYLVNVTGY
jgi:hypothetical protein